MIHDSPPPLRVALVQFRPDKARVGTNLDRVRDMIAEHADATDLLVFPEACLSGYFLQGGVGEVARSAESVGAALGRPPDDAPDVVLGFFESWRRRIYNSAALLTPHDGEWKVAHVHRKLFLPTYGVFDEARFVEAGTEVRTVDTRHGRIGLLVCEDAWHGLTPTVLALHGAELIVIPSASPARDFRPDETARPGNLARWERLGRGIAEEHGVFVAVAQLVGTEGGKVFAGGSQVFGPDGSLIADGGLHEETVVRARLGSEAVSRARADAPLLADLEHALPHLRRALDGGWAATQRAPQRAPAAAWGLRGDGPGSGPTAGPDPSVPVAELLRLDLELVEETLVRFLRHEVVERRGFEKAVVGVSGGVDSAVTLALACRALGPENVHGFRLPYRTSSRESLEHAAAILDRTGAHARTIDISDAVDGYADAHEPDASDLRRGNLMARTRAIVLFDQSAKLRALPLGTGNKSERLLGYYTWHADDSPPINPLGDLFKSQVWALARHLGIPSEIVEKPATADLVEGVTDEREMGVRYLDADPILYWLTRGWVAEELVAAGFDEAAVEVTARRLGSTHWKREGPTVAMLSSTAIGDYYLRPVDY